MRKEAVILVVVLFSLTLISSQLADSPWPVFRGNMKNTGLSPYDTSDNTGEILWKFQSSGDYSFSFESSPTIGEDGTIYIGSHENNLYAINPDGTLKWTFNAGEPVVIQGGHSGGVSKGMHSSPAISSDGTIYIRSLSNYLFAVNPDGTEKWRFPLQVSADTWSSPTIGEDGTVYVGSARVGSGGGKFYAINPDGTEKWSFQAQSDIFPTAAIDDSGTIYFGAGGSGQFLALDSNGNKKWEFKPGRHTESSVAIGSDGTIYFGNWDNKFYALNPDGTVKWEYLTGGDGIVSSPGIASDGTIYLNANDGYFYAFNPDGNVKWKYNTGNPSEITSSPSIGAEGTIYFGLSGKEKGEMDFFALNPDGSVKWNKALGGMSSSPSIGRDGTVYIASFSSVYALGNPDHKTSKTKTADTDNTSEERAGFFKRFFNWIRGSGRDSN